MDAAEGRGGRGQASGWTRSSPHDVADYAANRDALGDRPQLAPLALPALWLRVAARGGGAPRARRRDRRLSPPARLARLPPPRAAALPAQLDLGVPGALPRHDQVEPRHAPLRGLVRGPHRLPARGRRHAPATTRGLDAQPRAARGGLVPDQGPRHRLALGRALLHAPAGGRRRGEQQRQLAVDRLGWHRPPAGLPPHLQPGPPDGDPRPRRALRAPLRAGAGGRARRVPARAVDDAGRGAGARPAA